MVTKGHDNWGVPGLVAAEVCREIAPVRVPGCHDANVGTLGQLF